MSKLVIVESPAKAKTIKKYLGRGYDVVASVGHVRDLPKSKMGIDIENNFEPQYINIKGKGPLIKELKKAAAKSDKVYLATDPDREGEAISWHLAYILGLDLKDENRVTFNEITKTGVKSGMSHPRAINIDLVDAQQARRVLDRLVGYKLSPFLWKKIKPGLSAGRVQSVAVRLIVDREAEIKAFVPKEYWSIDAVFHKEGNPKTFSAKLHSKNGEKLEIVNKEQSDQILADLDGASYIVGDVKKGTRQKSPSAPFTTSTMQQEASRKLGFQAYRTMKAAQELYEGVTVEGLGAVGLITYMRTDSTRISDEAKQAAAEFITSRYGEKYLPEKPRVYKSKSSSQDGHEAIRPTMPNVVPQDIKASLTSDQYKLYKLVWERFIASQMANAILDTVSADINAKEYTFKASGYTVRFPGYTVLYEESKDEETEKQGSLPDLKKQDPVQLDSLSGNQHFTQPPARYTEASLIKSLEELGIGRPSTYAPTITTIVMRNYVERDNKQLKPTFLGEVTTQLMKDHFSNIVDVDFTANMEEDLDEIEEGKHPWKDTIVNFYGGFEKNLEKAEKAMEGQRIHIPDEPTDEVCEKCGKPMVIKMGRFGKFMACSGYPDCKNTKKIVVTTPGICPTCGGKILQKKSAKGKIYYGCEHNPECGFMSWDEPVKDVCPKCGKTMFKKKGKSGKIYCATENCGYVKGKEE
ncbi:type I DNA topoisomerase [Massilioclostridium coli]|uniref:type I DNA topoisomerase n=1 Tax=Massilioclostridium coli TaxID=1870991 RepID=UPI00085C5922|nr:type I DNA topoisomerase [Massilioclostridium coli]